MRLALFAERAIQELRTLTSRITMYTLGVKAGEGPRVRIVGAKRRLIWPRI